MDVMPEITYTGDGLLKIKVQFFSDKMQQMTRQISAEYFHVVGRE